MLKNKNFNLLDEELELEDLIDEIEDKQLEQMEMIKIRDEQIESLELANKELELKISNLLSEIEKFKNENVKLNKVILNNQRLFDFKINQQKNEMETLVNLTTQLEKQNEQIRELQKIKEQQEQEYEQIETSEFDL